jgi:DNA-directed RNA polymerase specialized sigma24 family protein
MSLYGMPLDKLMALAKKFFEAREFLGLSAEEAAKICGIEVSEIRHLERYKKLVMK